MHPTRLRQNLRVFWKLMNLQDCAWENICRIIMKTILQEKERIHYSTTIWFTSLFFCLMRKTIPAWQLDEVKSKKEVMLEASGDKKKKVHFADSMHICHPKNAELEPSFRSMKVESYSEVRLPKATLECMQCSLNKAHQQLRCHCKTSGLWWTSSWLRWRILPRLLKNPMSECMYIYIQGVPSIRRCIFNNICLLTFDEEGHFLFNVPVFLRRWWKKGVYFSKAKHKQSILSAIRRVKMGKMSVS